MAGFKVLFLPLGTLLLWAGGFAAVGKRCDAPAKVAILSGTALLWSAVIFRALTLGKLPGGNFHETLVLLGAMIPLAGLICGFGASTFQMGIAAVMAGSLAAGAAVFPLSWPAPAPSAFDPVMMWLHAYPAVTALALTLLGSAAASTWLAERGAASGCLAIAAILAFCPATAAAAICFWTSAGIDFPPFVTGASAWTGFFVVFAPLTLALGKSCAVNTAGGLQAPGCDRARSDECSRLASRCARLAAGAYLVFAIGVGMVWAATAWGRPWGWDAKETGALACAVYYGAAALLHASKSPAALAAAMHMTAAGGLAAMAAFVGISLSGISLHGYGGH